MFTKVFQELGLSEITQKVFNDLVANGATPASKLADRVGIPRPSVYDHLKILIKHGLVTERKEEYKKVFQIDNVRNIQEMLADKIKSLENEKKQFELSLPSLLQKVAFVEPQIKFYSGKEGMRQVLNTIMLNRDIETVLFWPMSEMMKVLGPEYLRDLNEKRVKRNIFLRAIWPSDKVLDTEQYPYLKSGEDTLRDLRFAPVGMTWNMGYWLYEDKVAFLSSEKEGFGFVVHSKDFSDLMKLQFENIWKISTPAKEK
ncbi:MAG: helix-turn-helix domain-containing protein [Candidatus Paceibacterota bacterium]|jgi:sugar-specific transcriptional regulator TrmB